MPNLLQKSMLNHYSVYSPFGPFLMTKREASYITRSGRENHPPGSTAVRLPETGAEIREMSRGERVSSKKDGTMNEQILAGPIGASADSIIPNLEPSLTV